MVKSSRPTKASALAYARYLRSKGVNVKGVYRVKKGFRGFNKPAGITWVVSY